MREGEKKVDARARGKVRRRGGGRSIEREAPSLSLSLSRAHPSSLPLPAQFLPSSSPIRKIDRNTPPLNAKRPTRAPALKFPRASPRQSGRSGCPCRCYTSNPPRGTVAAGVRPRRSARGHSWRSSAGTRERPAPRPGGGANGPFRAAGGRNVVKNDFSKKSATIGQWFQLRETCRYLSLDASVPGPKDACDLSLTGTMRSKPGSDGLLVKPKKKARRKKERKKARVKKKLDEEAAASAHKFLDV